MTKCKRWLSLLLCLSLSAALLLPVQAETPTVEFHIDAAQADYITQELFLTVQTRTADGVTDETALSFDTPVNRLTADGTLYIQLLSESAWVSVERLTDADGDGKYELIEDALDPDWAYLSTDGALVSGAQDPVMLAPGASYPLYAANLTGGSWDNCLYLVTVCSGTTEDAPRTSCYLRIYGSALPTLSLPNFTDVKPGQACYSAVDYVLSNGLMAGTGATTFSPEVKLNRATLAQILYAIAGKPAVTGAPFGDVLKADWYFSAATWADKNGLMHGTGNSSFSPSVLLSRQQLALVLFQYARLRGGATGARDDLSSCSDASSVADWAKEAMEWAVGSGLILPAANRKLDPNGPVTRGEMAGVLKVFWENILP